MSKKPETKEYNRRYHRDHRTWSTFRCKDCGRFTSSKPSQHGSLCPDCREKRQSARTELWREENRTKYLRDMKDWHKKNPVPKEITRLKWDLFEGSPRLENLKAGDIV